ncbi:MAG: HU family DNA-binding protein [Ignavibacteriaceae bacterium]|jgi:nucleoid DNA-binding protein|nr:MAG: HU family DNA-binding protein [Chlorobiota bacterium]KXK02510.1 MAG: DNA-binding protein HRL53 [Chlorobi bacterium OLB4]MBV6398104.1 hypothetical protein [Ignavibacteria bacterium]MCC6886553.1 HU family DNA-binding protein [Ignavibacteriales bacterium]MCE7952371.1 HU family DNA-binding protein [Chlorobi bacterium CHB7]MDL1886488.1 HU family DNA-binding protein [Ignavibacteria bacterium CHB1]MEB2329793.1 HU family DNA-binding protein [Ignavibacteriaceae bacterium]OQY77411.1 MAG: hypot
MNKKSLLNKIVFKSKFDKKKTEDIFNFIFNEISGELKQHGAVDIEGLGKFEIRHRGIKRAIDKKRNREYLIPPKDKIYFVPDESLIEKINQKN